MEYNRYMTGDKNQNLGDIISKKILNFVNMIISIKQLYIITVVGNLNFVLIIKMNISKYTKKTYIMSISLFISFL